MSFEKKAPSEKEVESSKRTGDPTPAICGQLLIAQTPFSLFPPIVTFFLETTPPTRSLPFLPYSMRWMREQGMV